MHDLLAEVRTAGSNSGGGGAPARAGGSTTKSPAYKVKEHDIEMGDLGSGSDQRGEAWKQFYTTVDSINVNMAAIRQGKQSLRDEHERSKALIRSRDVQQSRQTMQGMIDRVCALANKVKDKVQQLEKDNEASMRLPGCGMNSVTERTRTSITAGLKKKLKDEMDSFSDLRCRIQGEYRDMVTNRVYTVTGKRVSEDDVDCMIESGEAEDIFQTAVMADQQGRARALDTLAEVQERHNAIKALERGMLELHQIFLDMALLVEVQGEMLNNIEAQVKRSADAVNQGAGMVGQAKRYKYKTRRLWCWGTIILLIIIILVVVLAVQPWKYINTHN